MLTCKQVSNALARQDYATLSPVSRAALQLHVALCVVCGKYNRQVMIMQDTVRAFRKQEEDHPARTDESGLTEKDRESIRQSLRQNKNKL